LQKLGILDFFQAMVVWWDDCISELLCVQVSWWESNAGPADLLF